MIRNVTWAHIPSTCPMITKSKPSEEGEGDDGTDDREASSVEVPVGKIKDLPPPPKTQAEVSKSQYREAFEHS